MIYAVNQRTKEHRVLATASDHASVDSDMTWRIVEADADGWIEWQGGKCPLPRNTRNQVKFRDGVVSPIDDEPQGWSWTHDGDDGNVIAYRPILGADTKTEPPAWNGEGLPPVGCECEWRAGENDWKKGYIIAKWSDRVWLATGDELKEQVWNVAVVDFRPIRSEEDMAVEEIASLWEDAMPLDAFCRALYRAGYRKQ